MGSMELYISYAVAGNDEDESQDLKLCKELEKRLAQLGNEDTIKIWHRGKATGGQDIEDESNAHLNSADIILLLGSPDYIASDVARQEMNQVMLRYSNEGTCIIPIMLRPFLFDEKTPFGKLKTFPTKKVYISRWPDQDEAFLDVVKGIQTTLKEKMQTSLAEDERDILFALKMLDYRDQTDMFLQFLHTWRNGGAGAFFIHGEPDHGQIWLLYRLLKNAQLKKHLPNSQAVEILNNPQFFKITGRPINLLWSDLAKRVGLQNGVFNITSDVQKEIINGVYKRWQTETIVFIVQNLSRIGDQGINTFLQEFWQPLLRLAKQNQLPKHYLLMFLVDQDDYVDIANVPATLQMDEIWEPGVPLKLKKLAKFTADILDTWLAQGREFLAFPDDFTGANILAETDNGIPEIVLYHICNPFHYDLDRLLKPLQ